MSEPLNYEVVQSRTCPGEWRVEAVDWETDEVVYLACFSGQGAKQRAEEYAEFKRPPLTELLEAIAERAIDEGFGDESERLATIAQMAGGRI